MKPTDLKSLAGDAVPWTPPGTPLDPAEAAERVSLDIPVLEAISAMPRRFRDELSARVDIADADTVQKLGSDPVQQIAEFLYLLQSYGPLDDTAMRAFIEGHNAKLAMIGAGGQRRAGGSEIGATQIAWARFDGTRLEKFLLNWQDRGAIDQSDLGRLLIHYMSFEWCRRTVTFLAGVGLLTRARSPYGAQLIRSTGVLEHVYARQLRALSVTLRSIYSPDRRPAHDSKTT